MSGQWVALDSFLVSLRRASLSLLLVIFFSLLLFRLNYHSPLSLSLWGRCSHTFMTFMVLHWNQFSKKISYLYWGAKNWTRNCPVLSRVQKSSSSNCRQNSTFLGLELGLSSLQLPGSAFFPFAKRTATIAFLYNMLSCIIFSTLQFRGRNTDRKVHYKNKFVC